MDTLSLHNHVDQLPPNEEIISIDIAEAPRHLQILLQTPSRTIVIRLSHRRLVAIGNQFNLSLTHIDTRLPLITGAPPCAPDAPH